MSTVLDELSEDQREIVGLVRQFTDEQIIPVASQLERDDIFPDEIVAGLRELGLFGFTIPERYGGLGLDLTTYALAVCELSRGWMSVSGIVNTHFIVADMLVRDGTEEQRERFLPRMATGEMRCAFSMTEPECGSDVQAIRSRAVRDGSDYVVNGQKMWVTNGLRSGMVATLVKTDPDATPAHRGMSCLLVEKEPGAAVQGGLTIPPQLEKLGYKGVETTELVFADHRVPATNLLGGEEGHGFQQMMSGIEVGRVNVAARGVGVAQRAFEIAIRYAQEREAFGRPIAKHQGIQFKLAEMGTKIEAARLLMLSAARRKDAGERSDVEAGMAKLFATEICNEVVEDSLPHPRRLRLLEGVRDRAPVPRRAAAPDRRGHVRDPEAHHRPRPAGQESPVSREFDARETRFGRYLEDFEVGDVYRHWPGKTITEADDHLFCMITMNHHPLHIDAHYAETETQFGKNVVVGNLVYSLVLGMSVPDVSGKAIANLEIESLKHPKPTFHGDTIYAQTTVLDEAESRSKPDRGVVAVDTVGANQRGKIVCEFRRKVLVPKRPPG